MRWIPAALAAITLGVGIWAYVTYPAVGQLTYDLASATESSLYGLKKERVDIDGVPMSVYRSQGQGEPVLMLHGFSADKNVWVRFAKHLTAQHPVIIPDMAGHGETGFQPGWDYSVSGQTNRLVKLLDHYGIAKAHVIGNSMGGYISAYMALHHPDRIMTAGLVDPAGLPQPKPSELEQQLAQGKNPFLVTSREDFAKFYPMTMADPPFMPGHVLDAIADQYIRRRPELEAIFQQIRQPSDLQSRAAEIKPPVWILWGKQDRLIDVSSTDNWKKALPHAEVVTLDGIGHMPMVETPAHSAGLYLAFLSKPH